MAYKVLVVDDSNFFQQRLVEIINEHPELEVIAVASNGQEAIDLAAKHQPDIISMDYEMPLLDGVTAVRVIMEQRPVPIVMFSSLTYEGAKVTLDALEAGAVDFISKNFAEVSGSSPVLKKRLHDTLLSFARRGLPGSNPAAAPQQTESAGAQEFAAPTRGVSPTSVSPISNKPDILVIGASTGGPIAVAEVLSKLPGNFSIPIVVAQHMPANFTRAFAERLNRQCEMEAVEAQSGDRLQAGKIFVAPGGMQLMFDSSNRGALKIIEGDDRVIYKPSVDIAFASAAKVYGGKVLAIVLTGMGSDGCEGAQLLKNQGATIWAQDEASCVVYGMPKAVVDAQLSDAIFDIKAFSQAIKQAI